MTLRTPIPRKRKRPRAVHSERTAHITGHQRVVLPKGSKAREQRRAEIFARAGGRCEERVTYYGPFEGQTFMGRCMNKATEWSHARHGANKCDCLDPKCSIASCTECHRKRHAGGKPVPRKPKVLSMEE